MTSSDIEPLRFAPAREQDAAAMHALAIAAYEVYVERMSQPPAPMQLDYREVAAAGDTVLAWQGEVIVGMITVVIGPDAALVENVAVLPQMHGLGLGSRLLDHAEQLARTAGRSRVHLYTNEAMTENLSFYPRRGYIEVRRAHEHGYNRVFFEKHVSDTD